MNSPGPVGMGPPYLDRRTHPSPITTHRDPTPRQAVDAFSASLTADAQPSAGLSCPAWIWLRTFSTATRVGPFFLPRYCGLRFSAVAPKILPTGALPKNGLVKLASV